MRYGVVKQLNENIGEIRASQNKKAIRIHCNRCNQHGMYMKIPFEVIDMTQLRKVAWEKSTLKNLFGSYLFWVTECAAKSKMEKARLTIRFLKEGHSPSANSSTTEWIPQPLHPSTPLLSQHVVIPLERDQSTT